MKHILVLIADAGFGHRSAANAAFVVQGGAGDLAPNPVDALEVMCHWLDKDGGLLAERAQRPRVGTASRGL